MKQFLFVSLVALSIPFLPACGKKDDDEAAPKQIEAGATYKSSCSSAQIATLAFTDATTYSQTITVYSDASCATKSQTSVLSGTYLAGGDAASGAGTSGGTSLDLNPTKLTFTTHTDSGVATQTAAQACGKTWTKDAAVDVTTCATYSGRVVKTFTVYTFAGDTLYFGLFYAGNTGATDGTTSDKRHNAFADLPYTKQ